MCITVHPSFITGKIKAPASKSLTQRALVACLLSKGTSTLYNPGESEDEKNVKRSTLSLGSEFQNKPEYINITGGLNLREKKINTGESGLGLRLIAPVAALFDQEIILEGEGSILKRPMHVMEKALIDLGATCETKQGYLPIKVKGPLKGGEIEMDGSLSSQFLSGLLFALPLAKNNSVIHVKDLQSKPYIDLTMDILQLHGIQVRNYNYQSFFIPGNQSYQPAEHFIESDWSNATFLFAAGAINGNIEISGLNPLSFQGDKNILKALDSCQANYKFNKNHYEIKSGSILKPFKVDATETPDLFPPLASIAAYCEGTSFITGAKRLIHKESNRAESLIREFSEMGIEIRLIDEDTLRITGGKPTGGTFNSHNDHRIAMAGAILALNADKPIKITNHRSVNKSYPGFFSDLEKLNVKISNEL